MPPFLACVIAQLVLGPGPWMRCAVQVQEVQVVLRAVARHPGSYTSSPPLLSCFMRLFNPQRLPPRPV
jgi:hypothetical protein